MDKIIKKIQELKTKEEQIKAQRLLKESILKRRDMLKTRKSRAEKIHRVGAIVEKMGLCSLDDELLMGLLAEIHSNILYKEPYELSHYREAGKTFLTVGKKLQELKK